MISYDCYYETREVAEITASNATDDDGDYEDPSNIIKSLTSNIFIVIEHQRHGLKTKLDKTLVLECRCVYLGWITEAASVRDALQRWTIIERHWNKKVSLETSEINSNQRPSSDKKSDPEELTGPRVSKAQIE